MSVKNILMRGGFVFLFFLTQTTFAQFQYVLDQSIPVKLQGDEFISMPWAGGLNVSQMNTMDLNDDGVDDLAIFDRTADRVVTFVANNNQYERAPAYEVYFPEGITNWMLLRDYNGDGRKDIFTGDNLGIKVYTNMTAAGELPQWELFLFNGATSKSPVLLTTGFSGKINVQLNGDDLPAISDADGDGDLDLFVPKYPGGATIEFHKNLSVENGEPLDSLDFARTPQTPQAWGGVTECDCGVFAFNGDPCNSAGRIAHAGGKSLLTLDVDNDGDLDMLLSEAACSQLFLLRNDGTNAAPLITAASSYPPGTPAVMTSYPTAFLEDVDFDHIKDLIVTPNIFAREFLQTNFRASTWFYHNAGSNALPDFTTPNKDFLQEDMIDVGDNAVPVFFDADGDSDLDLFVGNYTLNFSGSIFYFENTGTQAAPGYTLITPDFMGLSIFTLTNIKPSFADMNGDFKIDLVFTASSQFGTNTQLYYLANTNDIGVNFSQELVTTGFLISATENISVTDVDHDGKNDLLLGKQNGALQFWKNTGSAFNPEYTLEDDAYLGLGPSVLRQNLASTTGDLNADGKTDLILGDQNGVLTVVGDYRNASDMADAVTEIVHNPLEDSYGSQNLGGRVWPSVANVFKADTPAIFIGNTQGGIHFLRPEESTSLPEKPTIDVYPNPVVKSTSVLTVKVDRPAAALMLTVLGQQASAPFYLQAFQEYSFPVHGFSRGIYLLYLVIDGKTYTRKIAID